MYSCGLKSKDLRRYVVEFHQLYPNFRELDLSDNSEIKSFKGITDDIRTEYNDVGMINAGSYTTYQLESSKIYSSKRSNLL